MNTNKIITGANKFFLFRLYRHYIIDSIIIVKKYGFKELIRKRGIKLFAIIIGYYTIRDLTLYVLIPLLIAKGIF